MTTPRDELERLLGGLPSDPEEIRAIEDEYQVATYAKSVVLVEGRGSTVVDADGKHYLDLYGGHAVALLGHAHPDLAAALAAQAKRLIFYSNAAYSDVRAAAVQWLGRLAPPTLDNVFLCNSGTEANEAALKITRKHTGRRRIVSMREGFHGRTIGALSATGIASYRDPAYPLVPDHAFVPFGDLDAACDAIDEETAAVLLEPVPSMGVRTAPDAYFQGLRRRCDEVGAKLVFDEVQTGCGRTGTLFYGEQVGVLPDLITTAKGIAGGFPAGCVFVAEDIASRIGRGEQGTTFGGGPLASVALAVVAKTVLEEDLPARAAVVGGALAAALHAVDGVVGVDGRGLLLGVNLDRPAADVLVRLREAGILVAPSSLPSQLRLMPPLVLEEEEAMRFVTVLAEVLGGRSS